MRVVERDREAIIERAKYIRREIELIFNDAAHWNGTYPMEKPIDPDPDGKLKRLAKALDAMLAKEAERNQNVTKGGVTD